MLGNGYFHWNPRAEDGLLIDPLSLRTNLASLFSLPTDLKFGPTKENISHWLWLLEHRRTEHRKWCFKPSSSALRVFSRQSSDCFLVFQSSSWESKGNIRTSYPLPREHTGQRYLHSDRLLMLTLRKMLGFNHFQLISPLPGKNLHSSCRVSNKRST